MRPEHWPILWPLHYDPGVSGPITLLDANELLGIPPRIDGKPKKVQNLIGSTSEYDRSLIPEQTKEGRPA